MLIKRDALDIVAAMYSFENTLPSAVWAWLGITLFMLNLIWTCLLLEAYAIGIKCGIVVICVFMTISTSIVIGIMIGVAISAGVATYDEERSSLLQCA